MQGAAPAGINAALRPYQQQSLAFMLHRERDAPAAVCGEKIEYSIAAASGLPHLVQRAFHGTANDNHKVQLTIRGGLVCDEMVGA